MLIPLDSLDHPLLDPYRNLKRTNQTRGMDWFIAEGRLVVERLLASAFPLRSVVLGEQAWSAFAHRIPEQTPTLLLSEDLVNALVGFKFHAGVIACGVRQTRRTLAEMADVLAPPQSTWLVCPATMMPDNLGSIVRIACALGIEALIVGERSADPFSRRSIRVSMGNIFRLPILETTAALETAAELQQRFGFYVIAATGEAADQSLPLPRPAPRLAIVLGNEAHGLDRAWLALADARVAIPMSRATDSLNVAQAAAVFAYQFTRVSP